MPIKFNNFFVFNFKDIKLMSKISQNSRTSSSNTILTRRWLTSQTSTSGSPILNSGATHFPSLKNDNEFFLKEREKRDHHFFQFFEAISKKIQKEGLFATLPFFPKEKTEKKLHNQVNISYIPKKSFLFSNKRMLPYKFNKQVLIWDLTNPQFKVPHVNEISFLSFLVKPFFPRAIDP
uniref:hypothetical protein n=1 Tax=Cephaleuros parasiticus TaxID=173370 RepID=UPI001EE0641D|nr:hypothetical protein MFQ79_pgp054 [Cephaleuros parasiticus]UIB39008.1 hypothetical protein [Cephaleuros parasiticus]